MIEIKPNIQILFLLLLLVGCKEQQIPNSISCYYYQITTSQDTFYLLSIVNHNHELSIIHDYTIYSKAIFDQGTSIYLKEDSKHSLYELLDYETNDNRSLVLKHPIYNLGKACLSNKVSYDTYTTLNIKNIPKMNAPYPEEKICFQKIIDYNTSEYSGKAYEYSVANSNFGNYTLLLDTNFITLTKINESLELKRISSLPKTILSTSKLDSLIQLNTSK